MISRRNFLLGGAGLVAAGGVGVAVVGPRRVGYELGLVHSPDHRVPASGREVQQFTLLSAHMPDPVGWAICVPPAPPVGVVLCLHGRNGDHTAAFEKIFLHDIVADLDLPLAIIGVDGGDSSYWHPRADGRNPMAMVFEELFPAVETLLGATLPRAVLGWSMGGYGALLFAEQHRDWFRAAVAASPALWRTSGAAADGAFDDEADFDRHDVFAGIDQLSLLRVRVDCGTDDTFVDTARAFGELVPSGNHGSFGDGFHDDEYWRSLAPGQLLFINQAFTQPSG
ncbi:MAG: alpha/beta hydrolase-fold protein [Ilumatobacteraceae bacterium]